MNKKSLIAIILLLSFVIAVLLFNQKDAKDEAYVELEEELKQEEKEIKQMKEENTVLEDRIDSLEEEKLDLKWENSNLVTENERLIVNFLDMAVSLAIVTDIKVSGGLLNLGIIYVTRAEDKLVQAEPEFTYQITKDVPIFMLNERNGFEQKDWDDVSNLDRTPLIEIFENGRVLFIRETDRDHDYEFESW